MDRNSVIGLVLIGLLLIGYSIYQRPSEEAVAREQFIRDSTAAAQATVQNALAETEVEKTFSAIDTLQPEAAFDSTATAAAELKLQAQYGLLNVAAKGEARIIEVKTDLLHLKFSSKGGVPIYAALEEYNTYDSLPMVLWEENLGKIGTNFTYPSLGNFNTSDFYFESTSQSKQISEDQQTVIVFTLPLEGGRSIRNTYTVSGNSYDLAFKTEFEDLEGIVTQPSLQLELSALHSEKSITAERNVSSIFYKEVDKGRDYLSETSEDEELIDEDRLEWVAFKQDFFSVILIGDQPMERGALLTTRPYEEENDSLTQFYAASLPLAANSGFSGKLYFGPNDYRILKGYGMELDKLIDLGWGIFGWVNKFLVIPIFDWLETTGMSYGIIILILTLVIKLLLSPLTFKNYLSSAKMRVLKPEIDALNEKNKDAEPLKKQQATMELYRKTGVSPFAGCIPMLIQLPILYAMFRFFPSSIQLRHEPFLWADDLSAYDSIASLPFYIPAYGDHVSLFTILMCLSTLLYTVYNSGQMPTQTAPGMPNMKVIMYVFPFFMLFFFNSFASGLSYYYFLANVISILQMFVIKQFFIDEDKIQLQIAENKKKKAKQGKSKFQMKLEEMAKQRGIKTNT